MFTEEHEKMLKQAFELYDREYRKTLPGKEELKKNITFSEKFEKRMQKLIKRQRKFYYTLIDTAGKRVASIIIIILAGLTVTTFSVKAIREPVVEFIIETYEKFTSIVFDKGIEEEPFTFANIDPAYIPESFTAVSQTDVDGLSHEIVYEDGLGGSIIYTQTYNNNLNVTVDTEEVIYNKIIINKMDGIIYSNKGHTTIILANENYVFDISGTVSEDEIIKIAESVSII